MREEESDETAGLDDLLVWTPETAYFWGRVAGDGELTTEYVTVRARDEAAVNALATVAGVDAHEDRTEHTRTARESAHDASVVRHEEEYELQIEVSPSFAERATAALGLPVSDTSSHNGYRFEGFDEHRQQLIRGLLEACGTVCFRESSASVGVSFVHDDEQLLETLRSLLAAADPSVSTDGLAESSSGGYWFGLADDADPAPFARWVYAGSDASGLYAADRRRKLRRSVERATGGDVGSLSFSGK